MEDGMKNAKKLMLIGKELNSVISFVANNNTIRLVLGLGFHKKWKAYIRSHTFLHIIIIIKKGSWNEL